MRKFKTRMLKSHRPEKKRKTTRLVHEMVFNAEIPDEPEHEHEPHNLRPDPISQRCRV
jgi:hypothetical protein